MSREMSILGGDCNPFWKNISQIGSFPQISGKNRKTLEHLEPPHRISGFQKALESEIEHG